MKYKHQQFGLGIEVKIDSKDSFVVNNFPSWIVFGYYPADFYLQFVARSKMTIRFMKRNLENMTLSSGK